MATLVTVIHVFVCLFLALTVLLQPGKGSGMGGAFGGGSTQSVFGGSGGSTLLRKATVFVAALFMLSSMTLAWLSSNTGADALKNFSAAERAKHERREALRESVLEGAEGSIEDGDGNTETIELGEDAPVPDGQGDGEPGAQGDGESEGNLGPEDLDEPEGVDGEADEPQPAPPTANEGSPAEGSAGEPDSAEDPAQPEPAADPSAGEEPTSP